MRGWARWPVVLAISALVAGGVLFSGRLAAGYVWNRPLAPDEGERLEELEKRLASEQDPLRTAALLGKLAGFRHERTVGVIAPYLSASHPVIVRMEAAYALGETAAPSCIPPLIRFYSTAETPALKLAALHALSAVASRLPPPLASDPLRPMLAEAREFFAGLQGSWHSLADGIAAWGSILAVFGGDETVERKAFALIAARVLPERVKASLCRLFLELPLKDADADAKVLREAFSSSSNVRFRLAALRLAARCEGSGDFLLGVALGSGSRLERREAVRGLRRTRSLPPFGRLAELLAEKDPNMLEEITDFLSERLGKDELEEFCRKGLASGDRTVAAHSCVVLKKALERWRRKGNAENWKAALECSLPVLLDILGGDAAGPGELRKEAWFALLALLPPGSSPRTRFDWDAPQAERRRQVRSLKKEVFSPRSRKEMKKRIDACCRPSPSPSPKSGSPGEARAGKSSLPAGFREEARGKKGIGGVREDARTPATTRPPLSPGDKPRGKTQRPGSLSLIGAEAGGTFRPAGKVEL